MTGTKISQLQITCFLPKIWNIIITMGETTDLFDVDLVRFAEKIVNRKVHFFVQCKRGCEYFLFLPLTDSSFKNCILVITDRFNKVCCYYISP